MPRKPIDEDIAAEVMFEHSRTCCVCTLPNKPVQIHHIDEDPSNGVRANLAVLCLECHDKTQIKGGFGRKLRAPEVIKNRNEWVRRVTERRAKADDIIVKQMTAEVSQPSETSIQGWTPDWKPPPNHALRSLVESLPKLRLAAYKRAKPELAVSTLETGTSLSLIIDVMEKTMVRLATFYPPWHFDMPPERFFSEYIAQRGMWHEYINSSDGPYSGTIVGTITASETRFDAEKAVEDMVSTLVSRRLDDFDFEAWGARWREPIDNSGA